jgi:hypothetical protein
VGVAVEALAFDVSPEQAADDRYTKHAAAARIRQSGRRTIEPSRLMAPPQR